MINLLQASLYSILYKITVQRMNIIEQIVNYIIRPSRDKYHINRLGQRELEIPIPAQPLKAGSEGVLHAARYDGSFLNPLTSLKIQYSIYISSYSRDPRRCVIYLHANNGSRVEGLHYLKPLLVKGRYNVCLVDFAGSGLSEGQYVSLGLNETEDLKYLYKEISHRFGIERMVLWGRSMGACTSLVYASRYPETVCSLILDSPFKDLRKLIVELGAKRTKLPQMIFEPLMSLVDVELGQRIGHTFMEYKMKQYLARIPPYLPMLFLVSENDQLVSKSHGEKLFRRCRSYEKRLEYINVPHHGVRSEQVIELCLQFLMVANGILDPPNFQPLSNPRLYPLHMGTPRQQRPEKHNTSFQSTQSHELGPQPNPNQQKGKRKKIQLSLKKNSQHYHSLGAFQQPPEAQMRNMGLVSAIKKYNQVKEKEEESQRVKFGRFSFNSNNLIQKLHQEQDIVENQPQQARMPSHPHQARRIVQQLGPSSQQLNDHIDEEQMRSLYAADTFHLNDAKPNDFEYSGIFVNTCFSEEHQCCKPEDSGQSGLYSLSKKDQAFRRKWEGTRHLSNHDQPLSARRLTAYTISCQDSNSKNGPSSKGVQDGEQPRYQMGKVSMNAIGTPVETQLHKNQSQTSLPVLDFRKMELKAGPLSEEHRRGIQAQAHSPNRTQQQLAHRASARRGVQWGDVHGCQNMGQQSNGQSLGHRPRLINSQNQHNSSYPQNGTIKENRQTSIYYHSQQPIPKMGQNRQQQEPRKAQRGKISLSSITGANLCRPIMKPALS